MREIAGVRAGLLGDQRMRPPVRLVIERRAARWRSGADGPRAPRPFSARAAGAAADSSGSAEGSDPGQWLQRAIQAAGARADRYGEPAKRNRYRRSPAMPAMCIHCGTTEAPQPLGYCPSCAANARSELVEGLKSLGEYLSSWAAFDDWLRRRGLP